ncbi:hypothetical protein CAPTEDRAFT_187065 [Capitella teleta]|uniref:Uncharacterized protein n=1 Tax=Capitella teleta TaxID=283909 RepID=R7UYB6_CAPTE|nr:hypothetical protein CAPTEDRAFT_187065 [Capitella teleta]|eukprot:ELU11252.1 hypothetical protein CAPTEDRAFT_187065 [Capitella teleta]
MVVLVHWGIGICWFLVKTVISGVIMVVTISMAIRVITVIMVIRDILVIRVILVIMVIIAIRVITVINVIMVFTRWNGVNLITISSVYISLRTRVWKQSLVAVFWLNWYLFYF